MPSKGTLNMKRSIPSLLHLGLVCLGVGPLSLVVQQTGEETRNWAAKGELGGSAFFGNTSQSAFSFVDSYDSEAELRGARSNNDGQIFVGVVGTF